jgi:hypothetical protein
MSVMLLGILGLLVWWWVTSLRAKEAALKACRRACAREQVQLLDETVTLRRLGFARDPNGRVRVRRTYTFEFSTRGNDRRAGEAVCLGRAPELVRAEWPCPDDLPLNVEAAQQDQVILFRGQDGTPRH